MIVTLTINMWWILLYLSIGLLIAEGGRIYARKYDIPIDHTLMTHIMVMLVWPAGVLTVLWDKMTKKKEG